MLAAPEEEEELLLLEPAPVTGGVKGPALGELLASNARVAAVERSSIQSL